MKNHKDKITQYIYAKDYNKPHLMKRIFLTTAKLEMRVYSNNISFPSQTVGRDAITKVLITDFNSNYENVYTYCLYDSLLIEKNHSRCKWFVVMNEKSTGHLRIGCGFYDWYFCDNQNLVASLEITIERMQILNSTTSEKVFANLSKLSYPWVERKLALASFLKDSRLNPIRDYLST